MPISKKSAGSRPRSTSKRSTLGRRLAAGLKDAVAHQRGEIELASYDIAVPDNVDVAGIRKRLGMSQAAFASAFGLDVTAIHAWEQNRRRPDRAARVLLAVISKEPAAVQRALAAE